MATLAVLIPNIRNNLSELTANFFTNEEIKQYIGEAYRYYFLVMVENGDGYFEVPVNLPLTAGTETIDVSALNPPFHKISLLEKRTSYGDVPLMYKERRFESNPNVFSYSSDFVNYTFKLRGRTNIILEPTPQITEAAGSTTGLRLSYVYIPTFPTQASLDTFEFDSNFPNVYDPMIELKATLMCHDAKDSSGGQSDSNTFRLRLSQFEESFMSNLKLTEMPEEIQYVGLNYSYKNIFNY